MRAPSSLRPSRCASRRDSSVRRGARAPRAGAGCVDIRDPGSHPPQNGGERISTRARRRSSSADRAGLHEQECSRCHHIDKRNRPTQAVFSCRNCGFFEHADLNASHIIADRGWWTWVCGAESQALPSR
ncbi:zinc ribbon domain-containing protein [Streptomyces sp. NPDC093598]|uniref:zinc ribbon domain-containing protein n=1 Tax=Streptomyces sp. NPDC093598 TaxID=3366046 RepID=UPI00380CFF64